MVYFFYGLDTFRLKEKLNSVIAGYQAKNKSGLNFSRFDFGKDDNDFNDLHNFLESFSMFQEKKLATVNDVFGASSAAREKLLDYLVKSDVLKSAEKFLVLAQELELQTDKRKGEGYTMKDELTKNLFKKLIAKPIQSEEFRPLEGAALERWIEKTGEEKIDKTVARKLANFVGSDLWRMKNEIEKLKSYKKGGQINEKDVEQLVKSKIENDIFKTIDALAGRRQTEAFRLIRQHLAQGESEIYILSMLAYQFKNLLLVKFLLEKGVPFYNLQKRIKLHPFVLKKSFEQSKNFSFSALKKIYERLLDLDVKIKTGRIEPGVALDLLVQEVAG